MKPTHLTTAREVVEAFGGRDAVLQLLAAELKTSYHWTKTDGPNFPAKYHYVMTRVLQRHGFTASPELWQQERIDQAETFTITDELTAKLHQLAKLQAEIAALRTGKKPRKR